jgi:hypothetical protein
MGDVSHTPGPWDWDGALRPSGNGSFFFYVVAAGKKLCAIWEPNENREANARLIAAAPDYHASARMLVWKHDDAAHKAGFGKCGCADCAPFRPIIAKAEGRPHA